MRNEKMLKSGCVNIFDLLNTFPFLWQNILLQLVNRQEEIVNTI